MYFLNARAARALLVPALLALAACVDEPTAPSPSRKIEPQFGFGAVLTVTNLSGGTDVGSLRWVLSQATGGEIIRFDPSLAGQTITPDTTIMVWGKTVTIEGPADRGIVISGGGNKRIF